MNRANDLLHGRLLLPRCSDEQKMIIVFPLFVGSDEIFLVSSLFTKTGGRG